MAKCKHGLSQDLCYGGGHFPSSTKLLPGDDPGDVPAGVGRIRPVDGYRPPQRVLYQPDIDIVAKALRPFLDTEDYPDDVVESIANSVLTELTVRRPATIVLQ